MPILAKPCPSRGVRLASITKRCDVGTTFCNCLLSQEGDVPPKTNILTNNFFYVKIYTCI